jgi:hypothetical protein
MISRRQLELALPVGRIVLGASVWADPETAGRALGLSIDGDDAAILFARVFAIRDVALGLGTLVSAGEHRRPWVALGIVCDLADAAAGLLILRAGVASRAGALTAVAGSGAAALGWAALAATRG